MAHPFSGQAPHVPGLGRSLVLFCLAPHSLKRTSLAILAKMRSRDVWAFLGLLSKTSSPSFLTPAGLRTPSALAAVTIGATWSRSQCPRLVGDSPHSRCWLPRRLPQRLPPQSLRPCPRRPRLSLPAGPHPLLRAFAPVRRVASRLRLLLPRHIWSRRRRARLTPPTLPCPTRRSRPRCSPSHRPLGPRLRLHTPALALLVATPRVR